MKGQSLHLCSALFLHTCHPMYVHCPSATHWIKAARTVPSTNNLFLHPPFRSSCLSFNKRIKLQVFHSWKLSIQATTQEMARKTCLALVTLVWCFVSPALAYDENMESALVPIVQCRQLLDSVEGYLNNANWDKARTNVNYCTRVLRLKTNMKNVTSLLSEDNLKDKAIEYTVDIDNAMTQLDASAYTPNFIPSDTGGITDQNQKYQMQAKNFYYKVIQELDAFLGLAPAEELKNAQDKASKLVPEVY
jgi:hypothetical protein